MLSEKALRVEKAFGLSKNQDPEIRLDIGPEIGLAATPRMNVEQYSCFSSTNSIMCRKTNWRP